MSPLISRISHCEWTDWFEDRIFLFRKGIVHDCILRGFLEWFSVFNWMICIKCCILLIFLLLTSRNLPCKDPWHPTFHITYSSIAYVMPKNLFMFFFVNGRTESPPLTVVCSRAIQHIYSCLLIVEPTCITSCGHIMPVFGQRSWVNRLLEDEVRRKNI